MQVEGTVVESSHGVSHVRLEGERMILATLANRARRSGARVDPGRRVVVEVADASADRGRIVEVIDAATRSTRPLASQRRQIASIKERERAERAAAEGGEGQ
jgi:translation initiation factor IF-1